MNDAVDKKVVPKATIFIGDTDIAWIVTESPTEIAQMIEDNPDDKLLKLTLGNFSSWGGKPLYVRAKSITSIGPPRDQGDDDD